MPSLIDEYGRVVETRGRTAMVTLVRMEVDQLAAATADAAKRKKTPTPTIQWLSRDTHESITATWSDNRCKECGLVLGAGKAGAKRK